MVTYLPQLPGILSTALGSRSGALKLAGTAFLAELLIVLLSGWQLHDYEASAAVWAVVIPLGVFTVVVGLPATLPGLYTVRRLAAGVCVYAFIGALVGYFVWAVDDGGKIYETHEAVIAGFAWPVAPFLVMLQAMHQGLGWYS
ncbi:MAG: hypothetical protein IIC90_09115 [Chloroflexi bacterium]|nr:hypothetical protein [Chloroflexota bacterium]